MSSALVKNKVVVITGGTSGIGLSTAHYMADKGWRVYSLARHPFEDASMTCLICDVTKEEQVKQCFEDIYRKENRIDAVINNAGSGLSGAFEYFSASEMQRIVDVNLQGAFYVDQSAIPYLKETKGSLIHIGSIAGELTIPFQTLYSVTKAGIHRLSEALALELKPFGIRVSCVMPGDTKTGFTKARIKNSKAEGYEKRIERSVARMEKDEQKGADPIKVAKVIYRCVKRKHPPVKVAVGASYKLIIFLKRLLPEKLISKILYSMYAK